MKERYKYAAGFVFLFLVESIVLYFSERGSNEVLDSPAEAFWWIIIFLSSGFEIIPETAVGRVVGTLLVVEGFVLLGFFFAGFAAHLVERRMSGGKIMKQVKVKDHILVCGWTAGTPKVLEELTSEDIKTRRKIVVLANLDKNPLEREDVQFVKGDPTRDTDLKRAGIMTANTAIISLDKKSDDPDAKVILTALAVESLNRNVYTCVELQNAENEKHLKHAGVDEIVCLGRLSQNLMVHSSLKHGLSRLFSELVTHNYGHEFYKIRVPKRFVGEPFPQALKRLIEEEGVILTAVERKTLNGDGNSTIDIRVNPGYDYILEEGDNMFVIASEEPQIY
ncbi:MAG: NAD-binding protein [Theionarchaea archaeon]|nr:NAD-binding protein [Theionarchaea archaeon]MBU7037019.1 NAD-binding protein [Theionarchaea archaeon]